MVSTKEALSVNLLGVSSEESELENLSHEVDFPIKKSSQGWPVASPARRAEILKERAEAEKLSAEKYLQARSG